MEFWETQNASTGMGRKHKKLRRVGRKQGEETFKSECKAAEKVDGKREKG